MTTLGALLKRQRDRHGWTQQEVVDRAALDRSSSYISSIETGKTSPSIDELDALARLFGTTSLDLLREASGITPDYQVDQRCNATGNTVANSLYHASFEVIFQRMW